MKSKIHSFLIGNNSNSCKNRTTLFRLCVVALATLLLGTAQANNAKITGVTITGSSPTQQLQVTGKWQNGWNLSTVSTDAVYVFYKYRAAGAQQWEHGNMMVPTAANAVLQGSVSGYSTLGNTFGNGAYFLNKGTNVTSGATTYYSYRGACLRLSPTGNANRAYDSCSFTLTVNPLLPNALETYEFKFFVQEMVYVPQGSFYVGDGDTLNLCQASDNQPYLMGATMPAANTLKLAGNLLPSVPATYPNGYKAFYVMKYALSNEAYADFLNMLTTPQQLGVLYGSPTANTTWSGALPSEVYVMSNTTAPDTFFRSGLRIYQTPGGGYEFKCDLNGNGIGNEANDGQTISLMCGYYSQANAYLEWAGLRPITDLEFEKAARGPVGPVLGEFPWGNSNFRTVFNGSLVTPGTETEADASIIINPLSANPRRCGSFARPSGSTRANTGASYYGVMDLSGLPYTYSLSVYARISNPSFVLSNGNAGDGYLSATGGVSDASWGLLTYKYKTSTYGSYYGDYASNWIYYNSVRGAISK